VGCICGGPTTNVGMVVEIEPGGWFAGFLFDDVMCAVSIQIPIIPENK
jgi:hypothetical protein